MNEVNAAILSYLRLNGSVHRKTLLAHLRNTGHDISDRGMRLAIVSLVENDGHLIQSGQNGYKLAETVKDYEQAIKTTESYIFSLLRKRKAYKRNFQRLVKPQLFV